MNTNYHIDLKVKSKVKPYHKVISSYLANRSNIEIIADVGSGRGEMIQLLLAERSDVEIMALDYDSDCLNLSLKAGATSSFKFDINCLETFPTLQVDCLILSHVLEHTDNPIEVLTGLKKMVKPGGIMIVAVPNPTRPTVFIGNLYKNHYVNLGHRFAWDPSHWKNFLENILELEVEEYFSDQVLLFPGFIGRRLAKLFGYWMAKKMPWLGFSNIAVIRI